MNRAQGLFGTPGNGSSLTAFYQPTSCDHAQAPEQADYPFRMRQANAVVATDWQGAVGTLRFVVLF